jgi:hypothetical protein
VLAGRLERVVGLLLPLPTLPLLSPPGRCTVHLTPRSHKSPTEEPMISLVTLIEFFESLFASIKRRNAEKAAAEAVRTSRLVDDMKPVLKKSLISAQIQHLSQQRRNYLTVMALSGFI